MKFEFYHATNKDNCSIEFHDRLTGKKLWNVKFEKTDRTGRRLIKEIDLTAQELAGCKDLSYYYLEDDEPVTDRRARALCTPGYGQFDDRQAVSAMIPLSDFDWGEDVNPKTAYSDSFIYCMHVRGYTAHSSSGVKHKGTFLGVSEKIDHLKDLGVTAIELQPVYEFPELEYRSTILGTAAHPIPQDVFKGDPYINYWGYKRGYYYAPKMSYSNGDPINEFKSMVKSLHSKGIEVIMQVYWPSELQRYELLEVLRFWVTEYHVDGFHLMGLDIPVNDIARDDMLSDTKLMYYGFDTDNVYGGLIPKQPVLATYKDDYLYIIRSMLKGDEGMVPQTLGVMRGIPLGQGIINYITNYYGFTMMDLVSYDRKHNEDNGENNCDGNDHNCSWNCGAEGPTRKKKIKDLRAKQYMNALSLLFLSQGTPLIFMGDEFGNSQNGNNNPYDQDNEITWLDWKDLKRHKNIYDFLLSLVEIRNSTPILHPSRELRMMDVDGCGFPDLSYHGEQAWRIQSEYYSRCFAQMYCSKDRSLYVAVNMHWEEHSFGLPKLGKSVRWKYLLGTSNVSDDAIEEDVVLIEPRSIVIFEAC